MKCELRIMSGGRAGHREVFDKAYIALGRHPLSDLRFDAERDLDVSTRHAALVQAGDRFVLRDLGSRNGTFVNGRRIAGDQPLAPGDRLRFGPNGPEAEFQLVAEGAEQVVAAVRAPAAPRAPAPATAAPAGKLPPTLDGRRAPSTTSVLRAEVRHQAARYRSLVVALGIIVIGALAVVLWQGRTARKQVATIGSALDSLSKELVALRRAQAAADFEAASLRAQLQTERDPARIAALRQRYSAVQQQQHGIVEAQSVDWAAIDRANAAAVAMIYVQFPDDSVFSGTGFAVSSGGLLLTNRHVVIDSAGNRPTRIGVQFSHSREVLRARIANVSADADIALLQITDTGTFATVQALRTDLATTQVGDPIALLGFPLGLDAPMGGTAGARIVEPTLVPGTIGKVLPDSLLQLDAYSGTGASGSPIFDRAGQVIGIEFGGLRETGGRIVLGLPITRAQSLLPSSNPKGE
jgi:S1-C subfamily serine protease